MEKIPSGRDVARFVKHRPKSLKIAPNSFFCRLFYPSSFPHYPPPPANPCNHPPSLATHHLLHHPPVRSQKKFRAMGECLAGTFAPWGECLASIRSMARTSGLDVRAMERTSRPDVRSLERMSWPDVGPSP